MMSTIHSVNDVPQITEEIARYTKCDRPSTRAIVYNKSDGDGGDIVILLTGDATSLFSSVCVYAF